MGFKYLSMTEEEQQQIIADAIHAREVERFHYDLNVQNYQALLESDQLKDLPKDWPEGFEQYQGATRDEIVARVKHPETCATLLGLQHRDKLRHLLACEACECQKVEMYHGELVARLPPNQVDVVIGKAKEARGIAAGMMGLKHTQGS